MPRRPEPQEPFLTLAPDWVCEFLSPSTAMFDRTRKLPRYHREGVQHAWLIDPLARTLEVFRRDSSNWLRVATHGGEDAVRAEPFDALELELKLLWL